MKLNDSVLTPRNSSPNLLSSRAQPMSQANSLSVRRSSVSSTTQKPNLYIANQRRQDLLAINDDSRLPRATFPVPLLINTMNTFFQATQRMEEEIMLPLRLKDMPVEESVLDSSVQPDNWHDIYTFIREVRNQLKCTRPFIDESNNDTSIKQERKYSNDDEGVILVSHENNQFSSASSTVSSDEFEQSTTSSYDTIKDELKYHYYGLLGSLDNLISITNRVTEKYREESIF